MCSCWPRAGSRRSTGRTAPPRHPSSTSTTAARSLAAISTVIPPPLHRSRGHRRLPAEQRGLHHVRRPRRRGHLPLRHQQPGADRGLHDQGSLTAAQGFLLRKGADGPFIPIDPPGPIGAPGTLLATGINDAGAIVGLAGNPNAAPNSQPSPMPMPMMMMRAVTADEPLPEVLAQEGDQHGFAKSPEGFSPVRPVRGRRRAARGSSGCKRGGGSSSRFAPVGRQLRPQLGRRLQPERLCTQQFCLFLREKGRFETIAFPFRAVYTTLGINDRGEITGASLDDPSALYPRGFHGFLRDPRGRFARFDAPSKAGTTPIGLNDRGQIVGNYCSNSVAECPNGRRGFLRERGGRFVTIHFPGASFNAGHRHQQPRSGRGRAISTPRAGRTATCGTRAGSRPSTSPMPSRHPRSTSTIVARSSAPIARTETTQPGLSAQRRCLHRIRSTRRPIHPALRHQQPRSDRGLTQRSHRS